MKPWIVEAIYSFFYDKNELKLIFVLTNDFTSFCLSLFFSFFYRLRIFSLHYIGQKKAKKKSRFIIMVPLFSHESHTVFVSSVTFDKRKQEKTKTNLLSSFIIVSIFHFSYLAFMGFHFPLSDMFYWPKFKIYYQASKIEH